jgi:hypothetical protein
MQVAKRCGISPQANIFGGADWGTVDAQVKMAKSFSGKAVAIIAQLALTNFVGR